MVRDCTRPRFAPQWLGSSAQYGGSGVHSVASTQPRPSSCGQNPLSVPAGHVPESGIQVQLGGAPPQHGMMQNCVGPQVVVPHANGAGAGGMHVFSGESDTVHVRVGMGPLIFVHAASPARPASLHP